MPPRFDDEEEDLWEAGDDDDSAEDEDLDEEELEELIEQADEFIETNQPRKAIKLWRKSLDRFSDEPRALFHFARVCHLYIMEQIGGEGPLAEDSEHIPLLDEAISSLDEALSMESENSEWWNFIAEMHLLKDSTKAAIEALRHSLEADPDQEEIAEILEELEEG